MLLDPSLTATSWADPTLTGKVIKNLGDYRLIEIDLNGEIKYSLEKKMTVMDRLGVYTDFWQETWSDSDFLRILATI